MQNESVEIDPFGCPYCGGPVNGRELRCDHCGRSVEVRQRKRVEWGSSVWLLVLFLVLGAVAWLVGYFVSQMPTMDQLPQWTRQIGLQLLVGSALYTPEGIQGDLAEFAMILTTLNYVLAVLCVVAVAGLALRSRVVYFCSFLLLGLMVLATGVGLLTGLTGWLPGLLRMGLLAFTAKWLADSSMVFEWQAREYHADVDRGLRSDPDYYGRGKRYYEMGMWAKAAAHWSVAAQLAPNRVAYHVSLAKAYCRMGYPTAAWAEADKALALDPADKGLAAFRDSLAGMEETIDHRPRGPAVL